MKRASIAAVVAVLVVLTVALPAGASPPDKLETYPGIDFPDFENGFVVFLNTTREAVCTPEQLDAELAVLDWFPVWGEAFFQYLEENDGDPTGFPGEFPPEEPPRPEGIVAFRTMFNETGKGAIVTSDMGRNIPTELWRQVENPPGVGPCTDTLGGVAPYATGTSNARANDNDLFGSDTRGNAFGNLLIASLTDADGQSFKYKSRFHLNSRCHVDQFAPPACLIERTSIK